MGQVAGDLNFLLQRSKAYSAYLLEGDPLQQEMEPILSWHIEALALLQHSDRLSEIETALHQLRDRPGMAVAVNAIEAEISSIRGVFERIWKRMPFHKARDSDSPETDDKLTAEEGERAASWQIGLLQTLLKSLVEILSESASPLLKSVFGLVNEGIEHIRSRR
ncbi:hypothetical protein [Luteibacter sp. 9135]|uniref:hypothetical protein n=1 Tax=Luteibacter sp. 9135 TaxID=1500893 RepID=UPI00055E31A7|nr:hypothetical protein [Luteibacter sp. 9135]